MMLRVAAAISLLKDTLHRVCGREAKEGLNLAEVALTIYCVDYECVFAAVVRAKKNINRHAISSLMVGMLDVAVWVRNAAAIVLLAAFALDYDRNSLVVDATGHVVSSFLTCDGIMANAALDRT
jgi:hypothetical protein